MVSAYDPLLRWGIALAVMGAASVLFLRARWNYSRVPPLRPVTGSGAPLDCMVVIPARDEEGRVGRAVRSFPPDTVLVVDDDSRDATAEEARRAGAGVIQAPPLPRGAVGKAHACQAGADAVVSRWVLFADADTWYEPGFLEAAVACAEAGRVDFLSIHPTLAPRGFAEHPLAPYAAALFFCAVNPRMQPQAAFNGQCLLARNESYRFIGGHGALRKYLADDLRLAALAVRHRLRFGIVRAGRLGHARFHADGIADGLDRGAARLAELSLWRGLLILIAATLASLWLPLAVWLWRIDGPAPGGVAAALPLLWLAGWYRTWRVILAPFAVYAALPLLYTAAIRALKGSAVVWKGRMI